MVELRRVTPRHLIKPHLSRWPFGLSDSPTADPHQVALRAWGVHRHEVLPHALSAILDLGPVFLLHRRAGAGLQRHDDVPIPTTLPRRHDRAWGIRQR